MLNHDIYQCNLATKSTGERSPKDLSSEDCHGLPNRFNNVRDSRGRDGHETNQYKTTEKDNSCQLDGSPLASRNSVHSNLKIKDNTAGALRYALHLRFLCPSSKKSSKSLNRCKSDPDSIPEVKNIDNMEGRRFYLYNDIRVVFPQRHSDSDEGKVQTHESCIIFIFSTYLIFVSLGNNNASYLFVLRTF